MVNNVNFTPQVWQSISLKNNEKPQNTASETTSNPITENRGTYPLMDARYVPVSFKGIPQRAAQSAQTSIRNICNHWSRGYAGRVGCPEALNVRQFLEEFKNSEKVKGEAVQLGKKLTAHEYRTVLFAGTPEETVIDYIGNNNGSKIVKLKKVRRGNLVSEFGKANYDTVNPKAIHDVNLNYAISATGFCKDAGGNDTAIKALKFEYPKRRDMRFELKIQNAEGIDTRWLCPEPRTSPNGDVVFNWSTWNGEWHLPQNTDRTRPLLNNYIL